jgi:hypothetical protein
MMLPSGTIRALRHYPDAIVCVVVAVLALSALALKAPAWPVIIVVLLILFAYDRRRSAAEAHEERTAETKVEMAVAKALAVRGRHPQLITSSEPPLPLDTPAANMTTSRRGK